MRSGLCITRWAEGWILPLIPFHWVLVQNIKRDPFEQNVGTAVQSAQAMGGALSGPVTAYTYDWNLLPIGENLWVKELMSYKEYPPLQAPATYNLDAIMALVKKANAKGD